MTETLAPHPDTGSRTTRWLGVTVLVGLAVLLIFAFALSPEDDRMRELYKEHMDKVHFVLKYRPHFEVVEVHYRDVLGDPMTQATRIRDFLGMPLDVNLMAGVVDESLYRNRAEAQPSANA